MSAVFRRCGCRNDQGKTYGTLPVKNPTQQQQERACPTMLTDPKHGSFSWRLPRGFDQVTGKRVVVNGGRVLGVTALGSTIEYAIERAYDAAARIRWDGAYYRKDIGRKALNRMEQIPNPKSEARSKFK